MYGDPPSPQAELKRLEGLITRLEERLATVEDALVLEHRAREALEERLAALDRGGRARASAEPPRPEPVAEPSEDDPRRLKSVLADWGFASKSRQKSSAEASSRPSWSPAPSSAPSRASSASSAPPKLATPKIPAASSAAPPPPAPSTSAQPPKVVAPRQPFDRSAPTVVDALERDATITPGQRETLRMIYQRFFPDAAPNPDAVLAEGTTVGDILETDPNLQHGQREALRTMYNSFGVHRRKHG